MTWTTKTQQQPSGARNEPAPFWWITRDGDRSCLALYLRHYSSKKRPALAQGQFVGPGEHLVLRADDGTAVFVWRMSLHRRDGQVGVECSLFRREGEGPRSSELVRQADAIADLVWPGRRHYTFVSPSDVRGSNPGFCFLAAGWRKCGTSKRGLIILERVCG